MKHQWNGNSVAQLHKPGYRPRTLLRDAQLTLQCAQLHTTAQQINDGLDKLHAQRAQQQAEQKRCFRDSMYPLR
jgi:hypothetical protein